VRPFPCRRANLRGELKRRVRGRQALTETPIRQYDLVDFVLEIERPSPGMTAHEVNHAFRGP
jgi:hypothetical protein